MKYHTRLAFRILRVVFALVLCSGLRPVAAQKLRIATWNITNYSSGRTSEFQTALYGTFAGRSLAPDLFLGQEFLSPSSLTNFLTLLNTAPGSPGDWAVAPWRAGNENVPDTNSAFFYRTSKVDFRTITLVAQGSGAPNQPRNTYRYDVMLKGYPYNPVTLACYSVHLKAGNGFADPGRRLVETQGIRANSNTLPTDWHFLIAGDFNVPNSSEASYRELVGSQADNTGRFFDPINTPGDWQNSFAFRYVHTQDPSATGPNAGGMDDRYDFVLLSANLGDGLGLDYDGKFATPYSTSTWNDANHSYRSWGNDGTSYNKTLTVNGNAMVGATIADALIKSVGPLDGNGLRPSGHLPVFLDLKLPPAAVTLTGKTLLEGLVPGAAAQNVRLTFRPLDVNTAPFVLTASIGVSGNFTLPNVPSGRYTIAVKGTKWLQRVVASVDIRDGDAVLPDLTLLAGDANDDNRVNFDDFEVLANAYFTKTGDPLYNDNADFNGDGEVNFDDFLLLTANYLMDGE